MGDSSLQELSSPSLADQAYAAIRSAIANGELPPGEKITERGLAAMLSVSATPIREAIRRLEQEGLVERRGARSTVVYEADASDRYELGLVEGALKSVAVRLAATNASDAAIERMEAHLREADRLRAAMRAAIESGEAYPTETAELLLLALRSFHVEAEGACGNAVLLRMLSTVNAFNFRDRAASLERRVGRGEMINDRYEEHHALLDAIRRRDADEAERLMAVHARRSAEIYTS
ncbi:MAG: GntR family transcriptional regulator [Acidimicrobiaceae bacterium]|nr:GntR family transcriptional regulator [Acidimicrobiaceae bacterium]